MQMGGRKGNCVSRCVFAAMRGGGAASALFARHIRPLTPPSFPAPVPAPSAPEENFYTVLFGVSRAIGVLSQVSEADVHPVIKLQYPNWLDQLII